jgi:hypothetical protein
MRSALRKGVGGAALIDVAVVIWTMVVGGGHINIPLHLFNFLLVAGGFAGVGWLQLWIQDQPRNGHGPGGGDDYLRGVRDGMADTGR